MWSHHQYRKKINRMTEDKIELNYNIFVGKLKKYNIYTEHIENDSEFNRKLKYGFASLDNNSNLTHNGSLIEHITRIAVIAYAINSTLNETIRVNTETLIRVCYLHQISKAILFNKNENDTCQCETNRIGIGGYSLFLCSEYGIRLTFDEYEAILSIDKTEQCLSNTALSCILRSSIMMAETESKLQQKK